MSKMWSGVISIILSLFMSLQVCMPALAMEEEIVEDDVIEEVETVEDDVVEDNYVQEEVIEEEIIFVEEEIVSDEMDYISASASLSDGTSSNYTIQAGRTTYFSFVPTVSDTYVITSNSSNDTMGYLYNSNSVQIASDDDSGSGNNFCIEYDLVAGNTYYIGVKAYSSSASFSYSISISRKTSDIYWNISESNVLALYGSGAMNNYIDGTDAPWYSRRDSIQAVEIGGSITSIGDNAFVGCTNLSNIYISGSVKSFGDSIFSGCSSLKKISIPRGVTSISDHAFNGSSLEKIYVYHNSYADQFLSGSNYKVYYTDYYSIFKYAVIRKGESIQIMDPGYIPDNSYFRWYTDEDSIASVNENGIVTGNNVGQTRAVCEGNFEYSDYIDFNVYVYDVVKTEPSKDKPYYSISFPGLLITEPNLEYDHDVIEVVNFEYGHNTITIDYVPLKNESSEITLSFPGMDNYSHTEIIEGASPDLTSIYFDHDQLFMKPNDQETLSVIYAPFNTTADKTVTYSSSDSSIVSVDNGVITALSVGNATIKAVSSNGLEAICEVTVHDNDIASGSFDDFDWFISEDGKLVIQGDGAIKDFGYYTYTPWYAYNESITSVEVMGNVSSIGSYTFSFLTNCTSISIPCVSSIGNDAFYGTHKFSSFYFGGNLNDWLNIQFGNEYSYPNCYFNAPHMYFNNTLVTELNIPYGTSTISDYTFKNFMDVTSVVIPESVYSLGKECFDCPNATSLIIPISLKATYNEMRMNHLESVVFTPGTGVGYDYGQDETRAWSGSTLTSVTLQEGITRIGRYMFSGSSNLTSVVIPNSCTFIGSDAFTGCYELRDFTAPISCVYQSGAFGPYNFKIQIVNVTFTKGNGQWAYTNFPVSSRKEYITNIIFEEGITEIPEYLCAGITGLCKVVIPSTVTSIGDYAFSDSNKYLTIRIPSAVTSIGTSAITGGTVYYQGSESDWNSLTDGKNISVDDLICGLRLNKSNIILEKNGSTTIDADTWNQSSNVSWKSNDTSIATVDENGVIHAVGVGSTLIIGMTEDGVEDSCTVVVKDIFTSIDCPSSITLEKLGSDSISLSIVSNDTSDEAMEYVNNGITVDLDYDSSAISIDSFEKVDNSFIFNFTALKSGDTTITFNASNGTSKSCIIHVTCALSSISFDKNDIYTTVDKKIQLNLDYSPSDTTELDSIVYSSSNNNVATVDSNGLVTAVGEGEATIYANGAHSCVASCTIRVSRLSSISLNYSSYDLNKNGSLQLIASFNTSIKDEDISWISNNPSVATVDENGLVRAVSKGDSVITIRAYNGVSASCHIVVDAYEIIQSGSHTICLVDGVPLKNSWKNSNGNVYYFDENGYAVTGWKAFSGKWYYFNSNGVMLTGVHMINGACYGFNESGVMLTGWQFIDNNWYYFDGSGAALNGWQKLGAWYYFDEYKMVTGLRHIDGTLYGFSDSGAMATGWLLVDGVWYYFNGSGAACNGWLKLGSTWYYFDNFRMVTGLQVIGNETYGFGAGGNMLTGWQLINDEWYYFSGGGAALKGWQKLGSWYYFYSDCTMAHNVTIDGYLLTSSGAMATGWQHMNGYWYYYDNNGHKCVSRWLQSGNTWYYLDANGVMVSGKSIKINGTSYFFKTNGEWLPKLFNAQFKCDVGVSTVNTMLYMQNLSDYPIVIESAYITSSKIFPLMSTHASSAEDAYIANGSGAYDRYILDGYTARNLWIKTNRSRIYNNNSYIGFRMYYNGTSFYVTVYRDGTYVIGQV